MSVKDQRRLDRVTGLECKDGRLFIDAATAALTDLSGVRLLRCGVDTVRQLYKGLIRPEIMELFDNPGTLVDFAGQRWHSGRVGRDSGYQYKLQNADLGIILLVKNFNAKLDCIGPHLKIEVSPHAIDSLSPERLQARLDFYAAQVMTHVEINQCAVHLALDLQGWTPPADLVARMHCKARTQRDISGISEINWATKSSTYGRGETSMFGSASGVQICIYNKTEQAKATDKLDYWEGVWRRRDSFDEGDPDNYNRDQTVWRVELRYHHSVIQQFASGSVDLHTGNAIDKFNISVVAGNTFPAGTSFQLFKSDGATPLLDTNNDGYLDRLYVGDTGGRLWRADFPGADRGAWTLRQFVRVDNLSDRKHAGSVIVNDGNGRFFEPGAGRSLYAGVSLSRRF